MHHPHSAAVNRPRCGRLRLLRQRRHVRLLRVRHNGQRRRQLRVAMKRVRLAQQLRGPETNGPTRHWAGHHLVGGLLLLLHWLHRLLLLLRGRGHCVSPRLLGSLRPRW